MTPCYKDFIMYLIKIDKRKKTKFEGHIHAIVEEGRVYVNGLEDGYVVEKENAKHYDTKEEAESAVTAEYEIVVKA